MAPLPRFFRDLSTRKKLRAPSGFTALFAADFSATIKQGFQHCQDSSVLRKNRISLPPKFSTAYPFHAFFDALPGRFRFRFIRARFLHYFSKKSAYFAKKAINFYTFSVFWKLPKKDQKSDILSKKHKVPTFCKLFFVNNFKFYKITYSFI